MRIRRFYPVGLLVLMAGAPVGTAFGQADTATSVIDPEKAEAIRTYLELSKTADLFLFGFQEAMASQVDTVGLPAGFLEQFEKKVRDEVPTFVEMLVPIYDKHLTLEELRGLNDFLATPLGQRMVALQMDIGAETAELGERWAMKLVGEVFMDLSTRRDR